MGYRTYIPTLVRAVRRICIYITKYYATIRDASTSQAQLDALDALNGACTAFLAVYEITTGD